jgi:hypothetical protein
MSRTASENPSSNRNGNPKKMHRKTKVQISATGIFQTEDPTNNENAEMPLFPLSTSQSKHAKQVKARAKLLFPEKRNSYELATLQFMKDGKYYDIEDQTNDLSNFRQYEPTIHVDGEDINWFDYYTEVSKKRMKEKRLYIKENRIDPNKDENGGTKRKANIDKNKTDTEGKEDLELEEEDLELEESEEERESGEEEKESEEERESEEEEKESEEERESEEEKEEEEEDKNDNEDLEYTEDITQIDPLLIIVKENELPEAAGKGPDKCIMSQRTAQIFFSSIMHHFTFSGAHGNHEHLEAWCQDDPENPSLTSPFWCNFSTIVLYDTISSVIKCKLYPTIISSHPTTAEGHATCYQDCKNKMVGVESDVKYALTWRSRNSDVGAWSLLELSGVEEPTVIVNSVESPFMHPTKCYFMHLICRDFRDVSPFHLSGMPPNASCAQGKYFAQVEDIVHDVYYHTDDKTKRQYKCFFQNDNWLIAKFDNIGNYSLVMESNEILHEKSLKHPRHVKTWSFTEGEIYKQHVMIPEIPRPHFYQFQVLNSRSLFFAETERIKTKSGSEISIIFKKNDEFGDPLIYLKKFERNQLMYARLPNTDGILPSHVALNYNGKYAKVPPNFLPTYSLSTDILIECTQEVVVFNTDDKKIIATLKWDALQCNFNNEKMTLNCNLRGIWVLTGQSLPAPVQSMHKQLPVVDKGFFMYTPAHEQNTASHYVTHARNIRAFTLNSIKFNMVNDDRACTDVWYPEDSNDMRMSKEIAPDVSPETIKYRWILKGKSGPEIKLQSNLFEKTDLDYIHPIYTDFTQTTLKNPKSPRKKIEQKIEDVNQNKKKITKLLEKQKKTTDKNKKREITKKIEQLGVKIEDAKGQLSVFVQEMGEQELYAMKAFTNARSNLQITHAMENRESPQVTESRDDVMGKLTSSTEITKTMVDLTNELAQISKLKELCMAEMQAFTEAIEQTRAAQEEDATVFEKAIEFSEEQRRYVKNLSGEIELLHRNARSDAEAVEKASSLSKKLTEMSEQRVNNNVTQSTDAITDRMKEILEETRQVQKWIRDQYYTNSKSLVSKIDPISSDEMKLIVTGAAKVVASGMQGQMREFSKDTQTEIGRIEQQLTMTQQTVNFLIVQFQQLTEKYQETQTHVKTICNIMEQLQKERVDRTEVPHTQDFIQRMFMTQNEVKRTEDILQKNLKETLRNVNTVIIDLNERRAVADVQFTSVEMFNLFSHMIEQQERMKSIFVQKGSIFDVMALFKRNIQPCETDIQEYISLLQMQNPSRQSKDIFITTHEHETIPLMVHSCRHSANEIIHSSIYSEEELINKLNLQFEEVEDLIKTFKDYEREQSNFEDQSLSLPEQIWKYKTFVRGLQERMILISTCIEQFNDNIKHQKLNKDSFEHQCEYLHTTQQDLQEKIYKHQLLLTKLIDNTQEKLVSKLSHLQIKSNISVDELTNSLDTYWKCSNEETVMKFAQKEANALLQAVINMRDQKKMKHHHLEDLETIRRQNKNLSEVASFFASIFIQPPSQMSIEQQGIATGVVQLMQEITQKNVINVDVTQMSEEVLEAMKSYFLIEMVQKLRKQQGMKVDMERHQQIEEIGTKLMVMDGEAEDTPKNSQTTEKTKSRVVAYFTPPMAATQIMFESYLKTPMSRLGTTLGNLFTPSKTDPNLEKSKKTLEKKNNSEPHETESNVPPKQSKNTPFEGQEFIKVATDLLTDKSKNEYRKFKIEALKSDLKALDEKYEIKSRSGMPRGGQICFFVLKKHIEQMISDTQHEIQEINDVHEDLINSIPKENLERVKKQLTEIDEKITGNYKKQFSTADPKQIATAEVEEMHTELRKHFDAMNNDTQWTDKLFRISEVERKSQRNLAKFKSIWGLLLKDEKELEHMYENFHNLRNRDEFLDGIIQKCYDVLSQELTKRIAYARSQVKKYDTNNQSRTHEIRIWQDLDTNKGSNTVKEILLTFRTIVTADHFKSPEWLHRREVKHEESKSPLLKYMVKLSKGKSMSTQEISAFNEIYRELSSNNFDFEIQEERDSENEEVDSDHEEGDSDSTSSSNQSPDKIQETKGQNKDVRKNMEGNQENDNSNQDSTDDDSDSNDSFENTDDEEEIRIHSSKSSSVLDTLMKPDVPLKNMSQKEDSPEAKDRMNEYTRVHNLEETKTKRRKALENELKKLTDGKEINTFRTNIKQYNDEILEINARYMKAFLDNNARERNLAYGARLRVSQKISNNLYDMVKFLTDTSTKANYGSQQYYEDMKQICQSEQSNYQKDEDKPTLEYLRKILEDCDLKIQQIKKPESQNEKDPKITSGQLRLTNRQKAIKEKERWK